MMDEEALRALADDIKRNGQREAITVHEGKILDGRNRFLACKIAKVSPTFTPWMDRDRTATEWVLSKNLHRRHLDTSQRALVAAKAKPMFEEEARKRQKGGQGGVLLVKKSTQAKGKARDQAAAVVNVSGFSVTQAEKVLDAGAPELVAAVEQGKITVSDAAQITKASKETQRAVVEQVVSGKAKKARFALKQIEKAKVAEQIRNEPVPMPKGPFRVIVSDPPWRYEKRAEDETHRSILPYPDMSTEEICALPVAELAHDDCVLWLWTTNAFMRDAFKVLDAWGFKEKTILTWVKDRMGTGDWLRGKTEHCILAVRGRPTVTLTNQTTHLAGPMREHSRKPDEFYALVDAICPGSKVEMFCREPRKGWAAWGAEKEKFS